MKKILAVLLIALLAVGSWSRLEAKPPKGWLTNLNKARTVARAQGKPIMLVVSGSEWCPPCKALEKSVLSNRKFITHARKNSVLCFIDVPPGRHKPALTKTLRSLSFYKGGVPAYACVDYNLKVIATPARRDVASFNAAITKSLKVAKKLPKTGPAFVDAPAKKKGAAKKSPARRK